MVTALRAAVDRLPFTHLADALDEAEEVHALLEQAAAGSGQAELHEVVDWFRQAADGIAELQQKLSAIQRTVTDMANRLEGSVPPGHPAAPSRATSHPGRPAGRVAGPWAAQSQDHRLLGGRFGPTAWVGDKWPWQGSRCGE